MDLRRETRALAHGCACGGDETRTNEADATCSPEGFTLSDVSSTQPVARSLLLAGGEYDVNMKKPCSGENLNENCSGKHDVMHRPRVDNSAMVPQPTEPSETSALLSSSGISNMESPIPVDINRDKSDNDGKQILSQISVIVYILVILFGISSWIDINGLWVEVPLLVNSLPEAWNLPSYLVIIIQIANIGPIVYMIINTVAPHRIKEWLAVFVIVVIGASACILLSFFWHYTGYIVGELHSTALIILTACLALVDCTSSVVYLPYMGQFKPPYMTAYYIGEGLSGLLPGFVGLAQGVGSEHHCINQTIVVNTTTNSTEHRIIPIYDPPRFGVAVFFIFLFVMMCVSGMSFAFLHYSSFCRKEHIESITRSVMAQESNRVEDTVRIISYGSSESVDSIAPRVDLLDDVGTVESVHSTKTLSSKTNYPLESKIKKKQLTGAQFIYLLLLTTWINALINGVLPSTQSYSCLPYGSLAYTLAVRLSTVANPLLCFSALFIPTRSLKIVSMLTVVGSTLAGYQLYLAAMSPNPPMKTEPIGTFLVITAQVLFTSCFAYVKVTNASIFYDYGGSKALLWCGGATQLGSCIGAVIIFLVINKLHVLHPEPVC